MTLAFKQTFKNSTIHLDSSTFENCTFENCTLVYSGLMQPTLVGNDFAQCRWEFAGSAANTINFLTGFYQTGGKDVVEATLNNIREGGSERRVLSPGVAH
jgi:hypothetical protein